MISSGEVQSIQGGSARSRRDDRDVKEWSIEDSPEGSIPPRYRDGRGGIDLEQVMRDQRAARRQVVRAMIRRLGRRTATG